MKRTKRKSKPAKAKTFKLGTYQLGFRWVDVFINPNSTGGEFSFHPEPDDRKDHCRIEVGFGYRNPDDPFAILIHEASEALLSDLHCRFRPTSHYIEAASDIYTFAFNHSQFTEMAARLGWFLWQARKDFETAWKNACKNK